ncbi:MAG: hypothetical protein J2P17_16275 [Mycobacterium sp.]|nr:hypothetical protein [Mycobacterium sp.]
MATDGGQKRPNLLAAHDEVGRRRPGPNESLRAWLAYYLHSAAVYEQEAMAARYWADRERLRADEITDQLNRESEAN